VPEAFVGLLIGKAGSKIKSAQETTNCKIDVQVSVWISIGFFWCNNAAHLPPVRTPALLSPRTWS
jgi:KH domain